MIVGEQRPNDGRTDDISGRHPHVVLTDYGREHRRMVKMSSESHVADRITALVQGNPLRDGVEHEGRQRKLGDHAEAKAESGKAAREHLAAVCTKHHLYQTASVLNADHSAHCHF